MLTGTSPALPFLYPLPASATAPADLTIGRAPQTSLLTPLDPHTVFSVPAKLQLGLQGVCRGPRFSRRQWQLQAAWQGAPSISNQDEECNNCTTWLKQSRSGSGDLPAWGQPETAVAAARGGKKRPDS